MPAQIVIRATAPFARAWRHFTVRLDLSPQPLDYVTDDGIGSVTVCTIREQGNRYAHRDGWADNPTVGWVIEQIIPELPDRAQTPGRARIWRSEPFKQRKRAFSEATRLWPAISHWNETPHSHRKTYVAVTIEGRTRR